MHVHVCALMNGCTDTNTRSCRFAMRISTHLHRYTQTLTYRKQQDTRDCIMNCVLGSKRRAVAQALD